MKASKGQARFLLRIPEGTHQKLVRAARAQRMSINQMCNELIESGLKRIEAPGSQLIRQIQSIYKEHGLLAVVLFGSRARGDSTQDSDIDLLLVFKSETKITRQLHQLWDQQKVLQKPPSGTKSRNLEQLEQISIHCVSLPATEPVASGFWLEIALDGIVLWGAENISPVLNQMKQKIASGQLVRKLTHGQPYWVLQNEK